MSLYELTPDQFFRVEPLLSAHIHDHMFCAGVLAGKYPGVVIADHPEHPQAALVLKDMWCYVSGTPDPAAFLPALRTTLAEKHIGDHQIAGLMINNPPAAWRAALADLVADRPPYTIPRRLYVAETGMIFDDVPLAASSTLHPMNDTLPALIDGDLPGDVQNVLDLRATATNAHADPDQAAIGFVALHGRTCAAWAMIDCIVGNRGEIGLFTAPDFRRQGLALATSAAVLAQGPQQGLTTVHWDVAGHNAGSIRTAEKLGLRYVNTYDQYVILFEQVPHLLNWAWSHLDAAEYAPALDISERLLALKPDYGYAHFLVGAASAGLGDTARALSAFSAAVDHGWNALDEALKWPPVQALQSTPEWAILAARIDAKSQPIS